MVEQLGDDWPTAGTTKRPSKAAKKTGDIFKGNCTAREGKEEKTSGWLQASRKWSLNGIEQEEGLERLAALPDAMTSAKLRGLGLYEYPS